MRMGRFTWFALPCLLGVVACGAGGAGTVVRKDASAGTGGVVATGGNSGSGGSPDTGGIKATGGVTSTGGILNTGGNANTGGSKNTGGTISTGGVAATGGAPITGGVKIDGGLLDAVGVTPTGGILGSGGAPGTGGIADAGAGGTTEGSGPCDIYGAGNTPCVAAHSTVRALYGAYNGNLYQVRRASDKTTKDIAVLTAGGFANAATQDTFCASTTCTISIIYDQSPKGNHLAVTPPGGWLASGGTEAKAAAAKIKVNGHSVYGVYTTGSFDEAVGGVGYRNNKTSGVAVGDEAEGIFMVVGGKHFNQWCCFDYGNAETNNKDNGPATMETLYFGSSTQWGRGSGTGPWIMADLEDGVYAGQSFAAPATNTSLTSDYVTGMLKGKPGNYFTLKGGDAQAGAMKTMYAGPRPTGYSPMKKEGAIILGVGGDNSHTGEGTFFEGCLTTGYPSDATEDAVQANVVAAGYGR